MSRDDDDAKAVGMTSSINEKLGLIMGMVQGLKEQTERERQDNARQRSEDRQLRERDRREILESVDKLERKVLELKETVDRLPPPPTKAEMDSLKEGLQRVFVPVVGDESNMGLEEKLAAIDKEIAKIKSGNDYRNGFIGALGVGWTVLAGWMAANRFPKIF